MGLFSEPIKMQFTPSELEVVKRPIVGDGGDQRLLRRVWTHLTDSALELEDATLQKVYYYAYSYGHGGYQDRFRVICAAAFRAGWVQP